MTRKDFQLIAETIRLLPSFETLEQDGQRYPTDVVNFQAVCVDSPSLWPRGTPGSTLSGSLMPG